MADFGSGFGIGQSTINDFSGAVGDLFAAEGYKYKQQGAQIEQGMYTQAAGFARQNEQFTAISTGIKEMQQQRELTQTMGATNAAVAGAGFESSGSALDLLAASAQQGALTHQVLGYQGQITEAGYEQQAKALDAQAQAAGVAAEAAAEAAKGSTITGILKGLGGLVGLAPAAAAAVAAL